MSFVKDIKDFVSASAGALINMCKIVMTGDEPRKDHYRGPNGTEFYIWKYKRMSVAKCPSFENDDSNRVEDINHASMEVRFVSIARAVGKDYFGVSEYFGISQKDIHRFLISVLNRFIIDSEVNIEDRFACDLNGVTDPNSKSCMAGRAYFSRISRAPGLLALANAARDNPNARCDALTLVNSILPIFLEGNKDFHGRFKFNDIPNSHTSLETKYNFYNYRNAIIKCQEGQDERISNVRHYNKL